MTVAELITKLSELDPTTEVVHLCDQGYDFGISLHIGVAGEVRSEFRPDEVGDIEPEPDKYPVGPNIPGKVVRKFPAVIVCDHAYEMRHHPGWSKL